MATVHTQMTTRQPPTALNKNSKSPGGFHICRPTEPKATMVDSTTAACGEPEAFVRRKIRGALPFRAMENTPREVP